MSQEKRYTDVYPLNSPYNHLSAEELKQWIREWHLYGEKHTFTPKYVSPPVEPITQELPKPADIPEQIEVLPIQEDPQPAPLPIFKKVVKVKKIKQPEKLEPVQKIIPKARDIYKKIPALARELAVMDRIDQKARRIVSEISERPIPGLLSEGINWESLLYDGVELVCKTGKTGRFYLVKISGADPGSEKLKKYLFEEINFSNVIIQTYWSKKS